MTAHGGLMDFIEERLPDELIRRFDAAFVYGCSEYRRIYINRALCAVSRPFKSGIDPLSESLFVSPHGITLTLDGRIDNRAELLRQTNCQPSTSNVELFFHLYQARGTGCFPCVLGDWSVAISEPDSRSVVLAKDYAGTRPLDYCVHRGVAAWSSELEAIVGFRGALPGFDEEYLFRFMHSHPPVHLTPFSSISAVPPGHFTRLDAKGSVTRRYYTLKPKRCPRMFRDPDYEAEFRSVFGESVRCRMNPSGETWAELSGGVDSTSIVFQAAQSIHNGTCHPAPLHTLSYVFRKSTSTNEDYFIGIAEKELGNRISPTHLSEDEFDLFAALPAGITRPQAGAGRTIAVGRILATHNAVALLSGQGGDAIMWSESRPYLPLADQIQEGQIRGVFSSALRHSISVRATVWDVLLSDGIIPVLMPRYNPVVAGRPQNTWLRRPHLPNSPDVDEMDSPESREFLPGVRESLRRVDFMIRVLGQHHFRSCGPIPASYPYLDRRLVEFMLGVPSSQKLRTNETRSLHRRALRQMLPEPIVGRRTKAEGSGAVGSALNRAWPSVRRWFDETCRLEGSGYIDLSGFRKTAEATIRGHNANVFSLMRAVSLEGWLRSIERWRCPAASETGAGELLAANTRERR